MEKFRGSTNSLCLLYLFIRKKEKVKSFNFQQTNNFSTHYRTPIWKYFLAKNQFTVSPFQSSLLLWMRRKKIKHFFYPKQKSHYGKKAWTKWIDNRPETEIPLWHQFGAKTPHLTNSLCLVSSLCLIVHEKKEKKRRKATTKGEKNHCHEQWLRWHGFHGLLGNHQFLSSGIWNPSLLERKD